MTGFSKVATKSKPSLEKFQLYTELPQGREKSGKAKKNDKSQVKIWV